MEKGRAEEGACPAAKCARSDEEDEGDEEREDAHHRHVRVIVGAAARAGHLGRAGGASGRVCLRLGLCRRCAVMRGCGFRRGHRRGHRRRWSVGRGGPVQIQGVHAEQPDDDSGDEQHTRQHAPEDAR
jgi:hypothetical protein